MSVLEVAVSGGCSLHPKPIPLYENRGSIVFMWGDFVSATTRQKYQATYGPIEKNDFYHQRMTREGIKACCAPGSVVDILSADSAMCVKQVQVVAFWPSGLEVKYRTGYTTTMRIEDVVKVRLAGTG